MSRKSWEPFEFRLLKERSVADAARILKRDIDEVARQASQVCEATWDGWYARHRCPGSPINPAPVLALAELIFNDFPEVRGDQYYLCKALEEAFSYFDLAKGNLKLPVERRFLRFVRHLLRRRLARACERRRIRRQNHQRAIHRLHKNMVAKASQIDIGVYAMWSKALYDLAVSRLDQRTRTFLDLRHSGRSVREIASVLGVSTKTLSNSYGLSRLAPRIQKEVCGVVLGLPEASRRGIVAHLLFEGGLTLAQVGRLLCVRTSLLGVKGWKGPAPDEDAALRLLRGSRQAKTAA